MKNLIHFNYEATKNRGLITKETTNMDFARKLEEEVQEFLSEFIGEYGKPWNIANELADVILVCFNIARHKGIDIEQQLLKNITKNLNR
jgi:NTP pyrophosphatase (non-canonical NTP hydrolase)